MGNGISFTFSNHPSVRLALAANFGDAALVVPKGCQLTAKFVSKSRCRSSNFFQPPMISRTTCLTSCV